MTSGAETRTAGMELADMNGPLAYWGPPIMPAARTSQQRPSLEFLPSASEREALARLSDTRHRRTWPGAARLLGALIADAAPEDAAA